MEHFLQGVAKYIHKTYGNQTANIAVVFPGKRARLFLNKYLSDLFEKPVWAPAYFTITELMESISGLQVTEKLPLLFDLFEIYKKVTGTTENIDDFYFYCEMILADFDDTDKYLVNAGDLFRNLSDLKNMNDYYEYMNPGQIEIIQRFWTTFQPGNYSDEKKSFITLWDALAGVYREFRNLLLSKKIAYEGMVYREAAEKIQSGKNYETEYNKYLFIGFNAINKCEDIVFSHFKNSGKGEFFWDYDEYYVNNSVHEAGLLLRDNLYRYPSPVTEMSFKNLTVKDKQITFVDIPSNTGQTVAVTHFLKEFSSHENFNEEKTAVILGDENLLPSALSAIPENIQDINVSMGYPLRNSTIYDLIFCLSRLDRNKRIIDETEISFYYKELLTLFDFSLVNSSEGEKINELKNLIIHSNVIYLPASRLKINGILSLIAEVPSGGDQVPGYLLKILSGIIDQKREDNHPKSDYEREFLFQTILTLKNIDAILYEKKISLATQTVFQLILRSLEGISVPFSGEPLKGLQVMGVLETRGIDFDHIIMLSLNEGVFPKSGHVPTFIPLSLRHAFGLPVPDHRDSLYAYYFYRLIQRAKNVVLVYNSFQDGLFSGERSRFLHQLLYDPVYTVHEVSFVTALSARLPKTIRIEKNEGVFTVLREYTGADGKKYLTPSAINTYITCGLKFYFRYIRGLKEPVEVAEELDPAMFGNVLHKAIELIYRPYAQNLLNHSDVEKIIKDRDSIGKALDQAFVSEYFDEENTLQLKGRNILIREIILRYLEKILKIDAKYTPFRILKLEEKIKVLFRVSSGLGVWLGGIIDRLDEKEEKVRIIDYKTGLKKDTFYNVDDLFDKKGPDRNISVFQVLMYSLLYNLKFGRQDIVPGIYFIRNIFSNQFDYHIFEKENARPVENASVYFEHFGERLKQVLENLFNPALPFEQTDDPKSCRFCPFSRICEK